MEETSMELVLPYLSPVDFMHVIETSKYLHSKHQSKIQEKRKQSLIRFQGCNEKGDVRFRGKHMYRCTKLPNGKIEGKYEVLSLVYYAIYDYINGEPIRHETYNYTQREGKLVPKADRRLLSDDLERKFRTWKDIDTSKMDLVVVRKVS